MVSAAVPSPLMGGREGKSEGSREGKVVGRERGRGSKRGKGNREKVEGEGEKDRVYLLFHSSSHLHMYTNLYTHFACIRVHVFIFVWSYV